MDNRPIGVFDSGVGGLTALEVLQKLMPREHIIYLGDSLHMPYGEKNREQIIELSRQSLRFLLDRGVKAICVACGTATINALDVLELECPVPLFGVVEPAVEAALKATENGKIGVLATTASIKAGTFQKRLAERRGDLSITARACPVFATIVEHGLFERSDPRVSAAAEEYLPPLRDAGVDTVILGCTHYPLLSQVVREYVGENVKLISSGGAAAASLADYLKEHGMTAEGEGFTEYFTTGEKEEFAKTAKIMLRRDISASLTKI